MKRFLSTYDLPLLFTVLGMGIFGIVMVYSASYPLALDTMGNGYSFALRQGIWFTLGLFAFAVASAFPFRRYHIVMPYLLGLSVFLLLLIFVPSVGEERNFATRWIAVGPILIQPSEITKIVIPIYISYILIKKEDRLHQFKEGVLPSLIVVLGLTFLILLQPDLGTVISLLTAYFAMLMVAKSKFTHVALMMLAGVAAVTLLAVLSPYRLERLVSFRDPFADPMGDGYQLIQSLTGITTGGFFGNGFTNSVMKRGFLPEPHTDFISAIIAEELGFFGALLIVGGFAALFFIGFRIYRQSTHPVGKLLAIGISAQIAGQAVMNLGAAIGLLPITGIPLPLISYGGSSLVVTMTLLGILMNVARYNKMIVLGNVELS